VFCQRKIGACRIACWFIIKITLLEPGIRYNRKMGHKPQEFVDRIPATALKLKLREAFLGGNVSLF
jgi:hypothetical protein